MARKHMTKEEAIHKLVQLAYDQLGYKEGTNNWNKYASDPRMKQLYGWNVQNQPWCAVFVNWLFINAFGYPEGADMTYGGSAACSVQAGYYKAKNAWSMTPHKGDQIFFIVSGGINHMGIVVDVSCSTITTIEGNTSDSVAKRTYYIGDPSIAGYGVPNWSIAADLPDDDPDEDDAAGSGNLKADGICGPATWATIADEIRKLPTLRCVRDASGRVVSMSEGWHVTMLQAFLNYKGADLDADSEYGPLTEKAVTEFQKEH